MQEGKEILDGEELGKTRAQTKSEKNSDAAAAAENGKHEENDKEGEADTKENGAETAEEKPEEDDEKAAVKRTHTMDETVKVCSSKHVHSCCVTRLCTVLGETSPL